MTREIRNLSFKTEVRHLLDKKYFETTGTVAKWWEPDSDDLGRLKPLYFLQHKDVINIAKPQDKTILDAGTGKGRFAISCAISGAQKVIAIDISEEMLAIARERARLAGVQDKISFELGDVESLKYGSNFFDVSICMETFVHLPNPQKAVDELARVTKQGGVIVANVTNSNPIWQIRYTNVTLITFPLELIRYVYFSHATAAFRWIASLLFQNYSKRVSRMFFWRGMSQREFLSLFKKPHLEIIEVKKYGGVLFPVFFLVVVKKRNDTQ